MSHSGLKPRSVLLSLKPVLLVKAMSVAHNLQSKLQDRIDRRWFLGSFLPLFVSNCLTNCSFLVLLLPCLSLRFFYMLLSLHLCCWRFLRPILVPCMFISFLRVASYLFHRVFHAQLNKLHQFYLAWLDRKQKATKAETGQENLQKDGHTASKCTLHLHTTFVCGCRSSKSDKEHGPLNFFLSTTGSVVPFSEPRGRP